MTDITELKGSRRELALIFRDDWKTAHEAAEALGRPTGSIFGVLRRMHAEGILQADSDPDPPTRGTQYRLHRGIAESLAGDEREVAGVGQVLPGQRLLMVERRKSRVMATKVLTQSESAGLVAWGAELPNGWLLAIDEDVDPFRVQELSVAFEVAGCRCYEAQVDAVVPGSLLRRRATRIAGRQQP